MIEQLGKTKRLDNIFKRNKRTFMVPVDDLLIGGPRYQFENYKTKLRMLSNADIDAVLGFPGVFRQFYSELKGKAWIINLTTSTILSEHTNKLLSLDLESALYYGCDAVAVHVNMTSKYEGNMIRNLGAISGMCNRYGVPVLAITYIRREQDGKDDNYEELKETQNEKYVQLVSHAVRMAVELGADIIKTNYTGSSDGFSEVVNAAGDIPIVVAGGRKLNDEQAFRQAKDAIHAGASGICFGRNLFYRDDIPDFISKVRSVIDYV